MNKKILKEIYTDDKNLLLLNEDILEDEEQDINTGKN